MSVSVVIPCYNARATIGATIACALDQSVVTQVIVVNDGSTDGSAAVLADFGERIQTFHGPNRGVSAARNQGIALADGEWIQFIDSDDLIEPDDIARRLAQAGDADAVICDWREFTESDGAVQDGALRRIDAAAVARVPQVAFAGDVWAPPAAVLYRASLARKVGGFSPDLPVIQDARFLFDAARAGGRFVYSPHLGARYRIAPDSLSRRRPAAFWGDVLTNGLQIEAVWRSDGPLTAERGQVLANIYNQSARALLACGDRRFFEAAAAQHRLGLVSRHTRLSAPLARLLGVRAAHAVMALAGRG